VFEIVVVEVAIAIEVEVVMKFVLFDFHLYEFDVVKELKKFLC
jgi:hypothetical protein